MASALLGSDVAVLDLLRKQDAMSVSQMASALDVTATAVRQRLSRLLAQGHIERRAVKSGRGRPSHRYALTEKGRRQTGVNFADLAIALWDEIRAIDDPDVRRGLIRRLAERLAERYMGHVTGTSIEEKMESLAELFAERQVPFSVDQDRNGLPILTALACPYPDLAEKDRSICALERILFSEVLGNSMQLSQCRLDGQNCCRFELN